MKIALFQEFGLKRVNDYLGDNKTLSINEETLRSILKQASVSFSLENCNRMVSTLLCELGFSYVQQSQRYVKMADTSYSLLDMKPNRRKEAEELIKKSFDLYGKMTKLKDDIDIKGRPKLEYYEYGIPIEDGRYILPLACNTNLVVTISGDQLLDLYELIMGANYRELFIELMDELKNHIPDILLMNILRLTKEKHRLDIIEDFYENDFDSISSRDNIVLINSYSNSTVNVGLGAVTSTQELPASETYAKWGKDIDSKAEGVVKRVMGYGHNSIIEQTRTTFGMMMSLTAYHQFIRHRLSQNQRESLLQLILEDEREVVVPPTIKNSKFLDEYLEITNEFKKFRKELFFEEGVNAYNLLLNCDQVKVITNTNARIDCDIMKERTCLNAQWEIRDLYIKKLKVLRNISEVIYQDALPSCMRGKCKEGKLSCGRPNEIRKIIEEI